MGWGALKGCPPPRGTDPQHQEELPGLPKHGQERTGGPRRVPCPQGAPPGACVALGDLIFGPSALLSPDQGEAGLRIPPKKTYRGGGGGLGGGDAHPLPAAAPLTAGGRSCSGCPCRSLLSRSSLCPVTARVSSFPAPGSSRGVSPRLGFLASAAPGPCVPSTGGLRAPGCSPMLDPARVPALESCPRGSFGLVAVLKPSSRR